MNDERRPSSQQASEQRTRIVPRYLSIREFVLLSGLSEATVRRRVREKRLAALQPGGPRSRILLPVDALDRIGRTPDVQEDESAGCLPGPKPGWKKL